jgi:16S rRNA C967 or C1407 C5-methylase (RsmB/RsmF family)
MCYPLAFQIPRNKMPIKKTNFFRYLHCLRRGFISNRRRQGTPLRQWSQASEAPQHLAVPPGGSGSDASAVESLECDATDGSPEGLMRFDKVLVDAPCSGSGVLCKRVDLRWRRGVAELQEVVSVQREILAAAVKCVKAGGVLVYSTCSIEEEENEEQVAWLLREYPGKFEVENVGMVGGGEEGCGVPEEVVTEEGYLVCLPHVHGTDGSFAARLRVLS